MIVGPAPFLINPTTVAVEVLVQLHQLGQVLIDPGANFGGARGGRRQEEKEQSERGLEPIAKKHSKPRRC
jgi:hypothetical protein